MIRNSSFDYSLTLAFGNEGFYFFCKSETEVFRSLDLSMKLIAYSHYLQFSFENVEHVTLQEQKRN